MATWQIDGNTFDDNDAARYLINGRKKLSDDYRKMVTQLAAANARITELEAQLAKPATIHEVIDDYGDGVTAVTL